MNDDNWTYHFGTFNIVDIDDCSPNPCQNGGSCIDEVDSYKCECVEGYFGENCNLLRKNQIQS